jgi:hypothetical protein
MAQFGSTHLTATISTPPSRASLNSTTAPPVHIPTCHGHDETVPCTSCFLQLRYLPCCLTQRATLNPDTNSPTQTGQPSVNTHKAPEEAPIRSYSPKKKTQRAETSIWYTSYVRSRSIKSRPGTTGLPLDGNVAAQPNESTQHSQPDGHLFQCLPDQQGWVDMQCENSKIHRAIVHHNSNRCMVTKTHINSYIQRYMPCGHPHPNTPCTWERLSGAQVTNTGAGHEPHSWEVRAQ